MIQNDIQVVVGLSQGLAGVVIIGNLAFAVARSRQDEAEIMRLVGADGLAVWIRLGAIVIVPVVVTTLVVSFLVAATWSTVTRSLVLPAAAEAVSGLEIVRSGLLLAFLGGLVVAFIVRVGLSATKRK